MAVQGEKEAISAEQMIKKATANVGLLASVPLSDEEFDAIRQLIYQHFGINLTNEKRSLVAGRLEKVVRDRGFSSFKEYYDFVVADKTGEALDQLANRISTNHTYFFRENEHFDFFVNKILPEFTVKRRESGNKDLRIWSAGCSSGEEPYTLVTLMQEYLANEYKQWNAGILATDISARVLDIAREGIYGEDRLEKLPGGFKKKYFREQSDGQWVVNEQVKKEVTFRRLNLMNKVFPFKRPFDVIFCRNVMIYFDQQTREQLVQRFYDWLVPGGYFLIGHSESLRRDNCPFCYVMPAVYRKEG